MSDDHELAERVARLEEQVARLAEHSERTPPARPTLDEAFGFLTALEDATPEPGAVMMVGSVTVPAGPVRWQFGQSLETLQGWDWAELAGALAALGNPVRLTLMKLVLDGTESTSELLAHPELASTGKLHHHLRQLVAAGWLTSAGRGRYRIPPERVVPLLVIIVAARR